MSGPTMAQTAPQLTLAAEYRVRVEAFDNPDFGLAGADFESIAHRALASAELSWAGPRLYAQLSYADEDGREPGPRPFDAGGLDVAQAWVELPTTTTVGRFKLKAGRQELTFAGNRLVSLRDGVTLRRAFDAAKVTLDRDGMVLTAFAGRPVLTGRDPFDDEPDEGERFGGVTLDLTGREPRHVTQVFWFSRQRDRSSYYPATGADRRETIGLRHAWSLDGWDGSAQAAVQIGRTGSRDARAWGGSLDIGRTISGRRWGFLLGVASGDDDPTDNTVGTIDPLYPNLGVFSTAPLYFPANQINIGLSARRTIKGFALTLDTILLGRQSLDDAVYANPGRPLIIPASDARWSAVLYELVVARPLTPSLDLSASLVVADALDGVTDAGGRDATFAQLTLTRRF
jgi:hypothetical protein